MPASDNNDAFLELFMQCRQQIYRRLFILVHNESDAEDLLQETAKSLWQHFDQYDPEKSFLAWAIVIARNEALNFLKKNAKSKAMFSDETYRLLSEMKIEEDDERNEQKKRFLRECLRKLSPVDRKILHLRYEEGLPARKMAEIFGRSRDGIYQTVARIHGILHRCVRQYVMLEQEGNG